MIYVDTSFDPDPATGHDSTLHQYSATKVLAGVLANEGADLSAHETLEIAQSRVEDFAVLAAEYETLAAVALQQRFDELLDRSGLGARPTRTDPPERLLRAAPRRAERRRVAGARCEQALPRARRSPKLRRCRGPGVGHERSSAPMGTTSRIEPAARCEPRCGPDPPRRRSHRSRHGPGSR